MKAEVEGLLRVAEELARESGFFSPEEMALPAVARQPDAEPEALYARAAEAREQMLDWLDRGEGVDRRLGLRRMDMSDDAGACLEELRKPGPVLAVAPLKGWDRAKEKVEADYGGDWSRLVDVARMAVVLETPAELVEAMRVLRESGPRLARRPDDNFSVPSAVGYRGVKVNVVLPNGHVGELQVHLKAMFETSLEMHDLYERVRGVQAEAAKEGRDWLTKGEGSVLDVSSRMLAEKYGEAWERATSTVAAAREPFVSGTTACFEYEGRPAEMLPGRLPVARAGGLVEVVRDLVGFMHGARRVSRGGFDEMTAWERAGRRSA